MGFIKSHLTNTSTINPTDPTSAQLSRDQLWVPISKWWCSRHESMTLHHFFNITTLHRFIYKLLLLLIIIYYYYILLLLSGIYIYIYTYLSLSLFLSLPLSPSPSRRSRLQVRNKYTHDSMDLGYFPVEFLEFPRSQGSPYHPHLAATLVVHLGIHMWHGSWAAEKLEDTNRVHKEDGDLMVI